MANDFNASTVMNNTGMNGSGSCGLMDVSNHPFFIIAYGLVFLVGLVLNGFTLRVYFCRGQHHQSSVTVYLKNLAAADFLLTLCLPLRIANYASNSVLMHHIYCNFGASAFYLNMYASILFMEYIAANRYLKIVRPLEAHALLTVRAAHFITMATWATLLAVSSVYITLSVLTTWSVDPVPGAMGCDAQHSSKLSLIYKIIHSFSAGIFFFVLISLVFFYYGTTRRLRQAQQRQSGTRGCKKLSRSKRNMLVLVSVFCVCFVPYHLVRLPYAFLRHKCAWGQLFYYLKELTVLLSVLNACLDPLIYFIFCKAFRAQLGLKVYSTTTSSQHSPSRDKESGNLTLSRIKKRTSISLSKQTSVL